MHAEQEGKRGREYGSRSGGSGQEEGGGGSALRTDGWPLCVWHWLFEKSTIKLNKPH